MEKIREKLVQINTKTLNLQVQINELAESIYELTQEIDKDIKERKAENGN